MHSRHFVNSLQRVRLLVIETIGEYIKMNDAIIGFNKLFLSACSVNELLACRFYSVKPNKNRSCAQILEVDFDDSVETGRVYMRVRASLCLLGNPDQEGTCLNPLHGPQAQVSCSSAA